MKARLADMEKEAAKLKEMQDKVQKEAGLAPGGSGSGDAAAREEADARSIYVGNVDYSATPEELQMHFQSCGTVNRVTILTGVRRAPPLLPLPTTRLEGPAGAGSLFACVGAPIPLHPG